MDSRKPEKDTNSHRFFNLPSSAKRGAKILGGAGLIGGCTFGFLIGSSMYLREAIGTGPLAPTLIYGIIGGLMGGISGGALGLGYASVRNSGTRFFNAQKSNLINRNSLCNREMKDSRLKS